MYDHMLTCFLHCPDATCDAEPMFCKVWGAPPVTLVPVLGGTLGANPLSLIRAATSRLNYFPHWVELLGISTYLKFAPETGLSPPS